jgi:SAM-dependent methyltransferase
MIQDWTVQDERWIPYIDFFSKGIGVRRKILSISGVEESFLEKLKIQNHAITQGNFLPTSGLSFHAGTFDIIDGGWFYRNRVDQDFFLEECNRVLRPCGVLFLSFWNQSAVSNRIGNLIRTRELIATNTISSFREKTRMNGFFIENIQGASVFSKKISKNKTHQ